MSLLEIQLKEMEIRQRRWVPVGNVVLERLEYVCQREREKRMKARSRDGVREEAVNQKTIQVAGWFEGVKV